MPLNVRTIITLFLVLGFSAIALAERLAVSAPVANIRSGPGTDHNVLWKIEKFFPLLVIDKSGEWYQFKDFENDRGWVHQSLVDKTPTVITKNDKCNIRSGPGTSHKILFTVERGIPFKVLNREGSWIHIEHSDGDRGWIHKALVW
ncbi:MAG: SH3 domain-containing protein [Deltaproteobacteria bacterium]|jgi:SH3-like domain-containing protein|nr:SH3 domain-containing protein [Deltaproteobacteria bacterium]